MTDPESPSSPFAMPEYSLPDRLVAEEADGRAEAEFADAVAANERGDNYTLLTVAFASVLFFAGMSGQVVQRRSQWLLVGIAIGFFVMAATFLAVFPRRI